MRASVARLTVALALAGGLAPAIPSPVASAARDVVPPSVVAPVARPRVGGTVLSAATPFTVSWSGADPSGIRSWRLQRQVDGGSWENVALPSATSRSLVVELASRTSTPSAPGRPMAPATRARATAATFRVRRVSETDPALETTGPWTVRHDAAYLGGEVLGTGTRGADATLAFTGSQVAWFGTRTSTRGRAEVSVDGTVVATVDLYRSTAAHRQARLARKWSVSEPPHRHDPGARHGRPPVRRHRRVRDRRPARGRSRPRRRRRRHAPAA